MDIFRSSFADRIGGIKFGKENEVYKFAKIKELKRQVKALHPDIELIDMGVGEPDLPADSHIVEVMQQEAGKKENRWYADNGIPEFQDAAGRYLGSVYGLKNINPYNNILHGIGSKPILAMLPLCFINPGDVTLTTVPGYPILGTYTKYLGGKVYNLPLKKENSFYPELGNIPNGILKRAKFLYINYPNNPTGQVACIEFYKQVVDFAYKNKIIVISDASYAAITYDDNKPLSFLSIDGAAEVGAEIHSLSKAFNMTGWRIAFIVGNPHIIKAYGTVKDNTDSGQFRAIQKAGVYALNHSELTQLNIERYSRRFDMLIPALRSVGFDAVKPKGTFYCYVPCPKGTKRGNIFKNAEEVTEFLIKEAMISTVPWDDAGTYLRFSITFEAESEGDERKVINEIKNRLQKLKLKF